MTSCIHTPVWAGCCVWLKHGAMVGCRPGMMFAVLLPAMLLTHAANRDDVNFFHQPSDLTSL